MKVYATLIVCMLATLAFAQVPVAKKAPSASLNVGASVSVPKASATVKLPKVKVSTGSAAKTAVSGSVKANVPKAAITVTPKITGPKVSVTASTKAKATVKADVPTGTCPQAEFMGLTTVAAYTTKDLTICKDMKSSCCTVESMVAYKTKFNSYNKRLSAIMWSIGKIPLMNVAALSQLSDKMRTPVAPVKKDDDKKPVTPVTPAKKDDDKKPVTPVTPAKKDDDKKRRLQSLTAKVAAPKVAVKAAPKAKLAVKAKVAAPKLSVKTTAAPKLTVKTTAAPKIHVKKTAKITIKLAVAAKPTPSNWNMSADGKTPLANQALWVAAWNGANTLASKRGSLQSYGLKCFTAGLALRAQSVCAACDNANEAAFKNGIALNTTSTEAYFKDCASFVFMLKETTKAVQASLEYASLTAPSADLTTALTAIKTQAYDLTDCVGETPESAAVKVQAKPVAKLSVKVAAPKVTVPKVTVPKVALKASVSTKRILQAVAVKATVPKVAVKSAVTVPKVAVKAKVVVPKVVVPKVVVPKVVVPKVVVPKVAVKAKVNTPKVTVPKVTVKAATKTTEVGTNGITVNSWTAYKTSANSKPVTIAVTYDEKCQANKLMNGMLVASLSATDIKTVQDMMSKVFTAVGALYTNCADATAVSSWTAFKGTKNVLSFVAAKAAVKATVAAKVTVPKVALKVTVPKVAAKVSVGTKRRLQAPTTNVVSVSATGVKVENYKNTGLEIPKELAGDGQSVPAAARLFGFATLLALAVSMFFN